MGFSCFACAEPFEAGNPACEKGGGDGHGQVPVRPVSALTKCGHVFHADCLKKQLNAQSGNAWAQKSCPVCHIQVAVQDIVRIVGNQFDASDSRRPRIDEILMANRKVREDYDALGKRFEMLRIQLRDSNMENEAIKRQNEELILRIDQLGRLNSIHKADIDRYKTEIEKLKNIIITLTEKLTGNNECSIHDFYGPGNGNGMSNSNLYRLEYTEELQRPQLCDPSSVMPPNILTSSLSKPIHHHHPPGFMYPMSSGAENGSDYQDSDRASQALSISPEVHRTMENAGRSVVGNRNPMMSLPVENQQQSRITCFTLQDVQVRDYDTNNNKNNAAPNQNTDKSKDFASKENNDPFPAPAKESPIGSKPIPMRKNNCLGSGVNEKSKVEKTEDEKIKVDDSSDKWYEKKSRRRATSASANRGDKKTGGKFDHLADKKLLYGSFECPTCDATWGSSQSVLNKPQTCRYCHTEVYPFNQGPILSRKQLEMTSQVSNKTEKVATRKKKA